MTVVLSIKLHLVDKTFVKTEVKKLKANIDTSKYP